MVNNSNKEAATMIVNYEAKSRFGYQQSKEYKVPVISNKTDKGKWLNAYINKFFTGSHNYFQKGKVHVKLKNACFKVNNDLSVMVLWFKNLKKLKQENFVGEVFNAQLYKQQYNYEEAA